MNIPKVRTWQVTFVRADGTELTATVNTINKRFAQWLANESLGFPAIDCISVRISLVKQ